MTSTSPPGSSWALMASGDISPRSTARGDSRRACRPFGSALGAYRPETPAVSPARDRRIRRTYPTSPITTRQMPAPSHGQGFAYWSHPELVAVCQQTVPGPWRWTNATYNRGTPAPDSTPKPDRGNVGLSAQRPIAIKAAKPTIGEKTSRTKLAPAPTIAHALNEPQLLFPTSVPERFIGLPLAQPLRTLWHSGSGGNGRPLASRPQDT
jgi:hypothetical protein